MNVTDEMNTLGMISRSEVSWIRNWIEIGKQVVDNELECCCLYRFIQIHMNLGTRMDDLAGLVGVK